MQPGLQVAIMMHCLQVVTRTSLTIQSKVLRGRWTLVEAEMAARSSTWRHMTASKQWCVIMVTVLYFYKCTQSQTSWYIANITFAFFFQMEIIPWLRKSNYYDNGVTTRTNVALDRTVFVGGIPGDFTADELAHAFQNEFGSVESVHYHTDTTFYPTGKLLIRH